MPSEIKCGNIYWLLIQHSIGHEFDGRRPYLVVDSDGYIAVSNVVCMIPLTSNLSNKNRYDVVIEKSTTNRLITDSVAKLDHLRTFDKNRLSALIGRVDLQTMQKIQSNLRKHFDT